MNEASLFRVTAPPCLSTANGNLAVWGFFFFFYWTKKEIKKTGYYKILLKVVIN